MITHVKIDALLIGLTMFLAVFAFASITDARSVPSFRGLVEGSSVSSLYQAPVDSSSARCR